MAEIGRRVLHRKSDLTPSVARAPAYISGMPPSKDEARRWIEIGIELTVIDSVTNRPIPEIEGQVYITGIVWNGFAKLAHGIVVNID